MCYLGVLRLFEVEYVGVLDSAVKRFEVLGQSWLVTKTRERLRRKMTQDLFVRLRRIWDVPETDAVKVRLLILGSCVALRRSWRVCKVRKQEVEWRIRGMG